jgi:outer membrane beta-barrel protein
LAPNFRNVLSPLLLLALSGCSLWPWGHKDSGPVLPGEEPPGQVIEPDVARRDVHVPKIRSQDFEAGPYVGILSVQDFEAHLLYGARASYHVTEDFFVEGEYGRSSVSDTSRREIGEPLFPQETIGLNTYSVDVGYNVLPGEVFLGTRHAMSSTVYLLGGVGNTSFDGQDFFTYNAGAGLKVLPRDWLALRLEARDRIWKSDLLGTDRITNNFEITFGVAGYF